MTKLQEIQNTYDNKLTDLKYLKAVSLLELLSDDEYSQICDLNLELFTPMTQEGADDYLHRNDILDKLIEVFSEFLINKPLTPEEMERDELIDYINDLFESFDKEKLCEIANSLKNNA